MERFRTLDQQLMQMSLHAAPQKNAQDNSLSARAIREEIELKRLDTILRAKSAQTDKCSKCGAHSVYTFNLQTRRCDEETTVFVMCYSCKHRKRIH